MRADHPIALQHAMDVLRHGGMVAFPTDTVYGLASLPFRAEAVERLFIAKGRGSQQAIAVLVGAIADVDKVSTGMGPMASRLAERFWPGPLTLVVPGRPDLPAVLSANATVGVRMPDHPLTLALLREIGPLAVTSANLTGRDNTNTAREVLKQLKGRVHLVLDGGRSPGGLPSTVVDCTGADPVILRQGPVSEKEIHSTLS